MSEQISILRQSLAIWRNHVWRLSLIVGLIALPTTIINKFAGSDSLAAAYVALASMIMNLALIWAVIRITQNKSVSLRQAYYVGTASAVRFFLTAAALALQFIPAALGIGVYLLSVSGNTTSFGASEKLLIGVVAVILALPTLNWVCRYIFSLYVVVEDGARPVEALRRSRQVVRGNYWRVLRSIVALLVLLFAALVIPSFIVALFGNVLVQNIVVPICQLAVSLFILPFMNIYLYLMYKGLAHDQG